MIDNWRKNNRFQKKLRTYVEHEYMNIAPPPPPQLLIFRGPSLVQAKLMEKYECSYIHVCRLKTLPVTELTICRLGQILI